MKGQRLETRDWVKNRKVTKKIRIEFEISYETN